MGVAHAGKPVANRRIQIAITIDIAKETELSIDRPLVDFVDCLLTGLPDH